MKEFKFSDFVAAVESALKQDGCVVVDDVELYTSEALAKEQENWDEEDENKDVDLSYRNYWIDGGENGLVGYWCVDDAVKDIVCR